MAKRRQNTRTPRAAAAKRANTFVAGQRLCEVVESKDLNKRWAAFTCDSLTEDLKSSCKDLPRRGVQLRNILTAPPKDWKRVAVACGAGLGKSTTLEWVSDQINRFLDCRAQQLAFSLELTRLPSSSAKLLDIMVDDFDLDTDQARQQLRLSLERKRGQGHITLLLDSLDQAGADPKGTTMQALERLIDPHGDWANCPIWVTGRQHAFTANQPFFDTRGWRLLRVERLDEPECRYLLDESRAEYYRDSGYELPTFDDQLYDSLSPAGKELARVPRNAKLLGKLPPETLKKLRNKADIYWKVYTHEAGRPNEANGLIVEGFKAKEAAKVLDQLDGAEDKMALVLNLLGAIAFEMLAQLDETGQLKPALGQIKMRGPIKKRMGPKKEEVTKTFQQWVRDRFLDSGAGRFLWRSGAAPAFQEQWDALLAMDSSGLEQFTHASDAKEQTFGWGDVTTLTFFAAWWACNWATDADRLTMLDWLVDPLTEEPKGYYSLFCEFWEFMVDMPDVEHVPASLQRERWIKAFAPLYDVSLQREPERPIRSTEFIYRSWERMEKWHAPLLQSFRKKPADPRNLIENLIAGLIPPQGCPRPGDEDQFQMGYEDQPEQTSRVKVSHFLMHKFCVTNLEYELFNPRHYEKRWWHGQQHQAVKKSKDQSADNNCPAVMVSWYGAWCFAKWLGFTERDGQRYEIALPTEAQWEYCCRAGLKATPFTFDEFHDGISCTAEYCNFDANHPYPEGDGKGEYRQCTLPVDGLVPASWEPWQIATLDRKPCKITSVKGRNLWGFFQMHGNVWEWCVDWYDQDASARVLRGGGWNDFGRGCRSAYRNGIEPDFRYRLIGFRLAAVPPVGAMRVKQA